MRSCTLIVECISLEKNTYSPTLLVLQVHKEIISKQLTKPGFLDGEFLNLSSVSKYLGVALNLTVT